MAYQTREAEFNQLKQLLQHDQRAELAELRAMIADVEARALHQDHLEEGVRRSLTQNLADLIHALPADRRDRLNNALSALLNDSMDSRIRAHEPALMDQMTRAASGLVRSGISQALAEFVQSIQQQINQQLSLKERAKARMTALRSGVYETEIVLQRALEGRPKSALLIHRPTGLLIAAANRDQEADTGNQEALKSSLLTALISFANDAMGSGMQQHSAGLNTLSFEDRTLVLAARPLTILALEYDGVPPIGAEAWVADQLLSLSIDHGSVFETFTGSLDQRFKDLLQTDLYHILKTSHATVNTLFQNRARIKTPPLGRELLDALPMMGLFLILIGGGFFALKTWQSNRLETQAETLIQAIAVDKLYDLTLKYSHDRSRLSVRSGLVSSHDSKQRIEQALEEAFAFAHIDLSNLKVFSDEGSFQ